MPELQFPPYALILICTAAVNIGLSMYAIIKQKDKTYIYFGLTFLTLSTWPLLYALELMIATPELAMQIAKIKAIPYQLFPLLALIMIYQLVKRKMPPKWLLFSVTFFAFFQVFIMSSTDNYFAVWAKAFSTTTPEGFNISVLIPGLWLKVTLVTYHYLVDAIIIAILFKAMRTNKTPYKKQYSIIIAVILFILILSALYVFRIVSFGYYNPIPASFLLASMIFAFAIFKYRLLSIAPYAKESVFDVIQNPVLIIDQDNRLIDYNQQAREIFRFNQEMIGMGIKSIFDLINLDWSKLEAENPVVYETKWGAGNNYKFSTFKKDISKDNMKGSIIVFSDITAQLRIMETVHQKEILTYKESILGDMHDGIGGVVATGTILAQSALEDDDINEKNRKISQIASLLENGSFELRSMLNILDKDDISWKSLTYDMRSYSSTVLDAKGINRKFDIVGNAYGSEIDFDNYLSIFRLFKEIITNIVKHSHAENVKITLYFEQDIFRIVIADDGVGIDNNKSSGFGLKNMQKRVEKLHGTIEINSKSGTTVTVGINI